MIDLHCHILAGLDDGPQSEAESVELARLAYQHGIRTIVATPHIREDYPFPREKISEGVARLRRCLARAAVPVEVLEGAEVALSRLPGMDERCLRDLGLGDGGYVLIESPYLPVGDDMIERPLFDLQALGFRPVLAHPERSPAFLEHPDRLTELVRRGTLCSVTAGSMTGRFGRVIQRFTVRLFREGVVHNVASDAHDAGGRPPSLTEGFLALGRELQGAEASASWFTVEAPAAILAGHNVGDPPHLRPKGRRRLGFPRVKP